MKNTSTVKLAFSLVCVATILPLTQFANSIDNSLFPYATSSATFTPPRDVVEISLRGKTYLPHEVSAKAGDTIRICNNDTIFHRPFSMSKFNQFGNPKGIQLKPGECTTQVVQNPTKIDLCVTLSDDIHAQERGMVRVSPTGGAMSLSGSWKMVQETPEGAKYAGNMLLVQDGPTLSGTVEWELKARARFSGHIDKCNQINFSLEYSGGMVAAYQGKLGENGLEMSDGSARSNTGSPILIWFASR